MEMKQLESFVTACERGSISQAAACMYTTQPNVSKTIRTLEHELGRPLLVRSGKGVQPTVYGKTVLEYAKLILRATATISSLAVPDEQDGLRLSTYPTISVYKANMIIPQIAENKTKSGACPVPDVCPCCGSTLVVRQSSGGIRQLYCENEACPASLVRKFVHFCSKTRMEIKGLDEQTLTTFVQHGWVKNYGDLYELEQHRDEILETPGFGVKSFNRLQKAVDERRICTLNQFIAGLGIPEVGRHAGRILSRKFGGSWEAFEQAILEQFDFTQLEDFGQVMNDNIYNWYNDAEEAKLWRPALYHITFLKEENTMPEVQNNPFAGKTVVATGKLENYTRDGIQLKLLSLGARPASSVSKKTDYLIVGENAGSKLTKAQDLGVTTLTEQQFLQMLANAGIEA